MNLSKYLFVIFVFVPSFVFAQIYSQKDIVNQYDPFTLQLNDMTINTNDEDFREHAYVIIVTVTIGNEKVTKFLNKDDLIMNVVKNYDDNFWNINFTVKRNNMLIFPSAVNLINTPSSVTIKLEGYSNINEGDQVLLNQVSTSFCYVSSNMYNLMDQVYKYLAGTTEINRPNNSLLTTAEILQQNMGKRPEIFYMGSPTEITYVLPQDPKKVIGTNLLVQGKRSIEAKTALKVNDQWNVTITKIPDVKIVQSQPYYVKIKGVFIDLTSLQIIPDDKREGYLSKAQTIISEDLVPGRNEGVYINDQVANQYINLLNLLKAGVRVKADSLSSTSDLMLSQEREALSYFENNLRENDYYLDNQYLYDDYINSSVNRGIIQKEVDLIKRYYQIK